MSATGMSHHIEIFTGGCGICRETVDLVTIGKCRDCVLEVLNVDSEEEHVRTRMRDYGITAVSTIVIDGRIKVVGKPRFPWFCGDEFYKFLQENYPLLAKLRRTA